MLFFHGYENFHLRINGLKSFQLKLADIKIAKIKEMKS